MLFVFFLFFLALVFAALQSKTLIPVKPFTLRTECEKIIVFDDIFTKPEVYHTLFGNVYYEGYHHSLGILALFSLTLLPFQTLEEHFVFPTLKDTLDFPTLNAIEHSRLKSSTDDNEGTEEMVQLLRKYFFPENVLKCTIRQVLENKELFHAMLELSGPNSSQILSLPLVKILAMSKLNSLNNQKFEGLEEYFTLLDSPHYLPYLLRLPRIGFEKIDLISLLKIAPSSIHSLPARLNHLFICDIDFTLGSSLITLYHLYPQTFSKIASFYQVANITEFVNRMRTEWAVEFQSDIDFFLKEFNPTTPLVILPYRPLVYPQQCFSTGNTLHLYTDTSLAEIQLSLINHKLHIDKLRCPVYHIFRISQNIEYVATSLPYEEDAVPGMLYAVSMDIIDRFELEKVFASIQDVEFLVDALVDRGFNIFSIHKSQRT